MVQLFRLCSTWLKPPFDLATLTACSLSPLSVATDAKSRVLLWLKCLSLPAPPFEIFDRVLCYVYSTLANGIINSSTCAHCCVRSNLRMLIVCNYVTAHVDATNACATAYETICRLSLRPPLCRLPLDVWFSCLLQHLQEPTSVLHLLCRPWSPPHLCPTQQAK